MDVGTKRGADAGAARVRTSLSLLDPRRAMESSSRMAKEPAAHERKSVFFLARFERCPIVTFQLNYLDRISQRRIVVVTDRHTISVDLVVDLVSVDGKTSHLSCESDAAFIAMHRAMLESNGRDICDFEGGMRVVEMIDAIERAARAGTWIEP